jgi:chromosome partitioning protein
MYDVMTREASLAETAVEVEENLAVLPSTIDLAGAEVELAGQVGRELVFRDRIEAEDPPYDLLLIDCAPSLGLLTLNALAATDEVLIPLQPHFLALQGLSRLLDTISLVHRRINTELRVSGVVFCMNESGTNLAAEVAEDVRGFFESAHGGQAAWSNTRVFRTRIRRNIKLAECPSHGTNIFNYDPASKGAEDYAGLADEFLDPAGFDAAAEASQAAHTESPGRRLHRFTPTPAASIPVSPPSTPDEADADDGSADDRETGPEPTADEPADRPTAALPGRRIPSTHCLPAPPAEYRPSGEEAPADSPPDPSPSRPPGEHAETAPGARPGAASADSDPTEPTSYAP